MRVLSLSLKQQEEEWKSVVRILAKGLLEYGYFPFEMPQAFTAAVIFGEYSVSPDLIFDSLMLCNRGQLDCIDYRIIQNTFCLLPYLIIVHLLLR